ncbi:SLAC1 family transporter [Streptomyces paludis]|uniref:C4-dicarboxylate ABC transporter n=1 Tax=Streptomyces paludis TaxID=2282738 RepID=A0A345HJV2_9ACTN|nr:C4-dicarboxylate ABC transporter [Streptomyces paludis]AXG76976.1 C4-dicarboxylate ABC transporter [Streptomyces paludis]
MVTTDALRHFGPHWYAPVMGTAVVATAGAALGSGPRAVYGAVWALSAVLLVLVPAARAGHWRHHPGQARAHLLDPAVAPFYGCLAMAPLAVGTATLTVGRDVLGGRAALAVAAVLFGAGTLLGLVVAVTVPYLIAVRHRPAVADVSPVWLLPVVAPMVSAASAPLLVPYLPAGQWRAALLFGGYGLFGVSLLATLALLPLILARLLLGGPPPLALTPALFLVLGPLGQSVTAVHQLAGAAVGTPYAGVLAALAVGYGVPVLGFALFWLALAAALVVRAVRRGMRFSMTWWAFTFPVGTCVTGAAGLGRRTGLVALEWLAVALFALLVAAWAVAAWCTLRGLLRGALPAAAGAATGVGAGVPARARTA